MGKGIPGISENSVECLAILCFISLCHYGFSGIYCTEPKRHLGQTKPFKQFSMSLNEKQSDRTDFVMWRYMKSTTKSLVKIKYMMDY